MSAFDSESFLATLTKKPGVYQMIDAAGDVLYVGKARNLKNRVTSYFRAAGLQTKTMAMVAKIADIEVTITGSETEALLLEQSLIKDKKPPYNIVLRDDKSYPFIYLTDHKDYPRLTFHRGAKSKTGRYFGPFPSAYAVRDSLNILQKVFQLRNCDDTYFKNRSRPCLQHQIKRCTAPCVNLIDADEYQQDVELAVMFLEGKSQSVLKHFKDQMEACAQKQEYERAARIRDQISHLRRVQESQHVHSASGDVDVFAAVVEQGVACVQGLFIRGGRMLGQRTYFPKDQLDHAASELVDAFISQYYLAASGREIPKLIVTNELLQDADVLASALQERAGRKVELAHAVRGQRARWLQLAQENAVASVQTYLANRRNVFSRFVELQDALQLDEIPERIECFDISHTMGEATVASCVVFDRNGPLKSDYRRFNIEGIAHGDDYAAMEQALQRRYKRIQAGEVALPDVLIIDGGKGQLGKAHAVLDAYDMTDTHVLGIAKGVDRKPGLERYFWEGGEVSIDPSSGAAHLLQHIRDEAHRFAITGHRQRRGKQRRKSGLEEIPGVGPKRRRDLLTHFGSLAAIKGAGMDEIAKVPGINRKLAEQIYSSVHE